MKCEQWKYKVENAKPCPFCGSTSISVQHAECRFIGHAEWGSKVRVMKAYCVCNKCKARSKPVKYVGYDYGYDSEHMPVYAKGYEALQEWNKRAAAAHEKWVFVTEDDNSYPEVYTPVLVEEEDGTFNVATCDADYEWHISNGENSLKLIGNIVKWKAI